jgi:hypothetical protein
MKASDILLAAKQRVERGWCKGQYARDSSGFPCVSNSAEASRWCAAGAIRVVSPLTPFVQDDSSPAHEAYNQLARAVGVLSGSRTPVNGVFKWNDDPNTTKEQVLEAFDQAIKQAIAEGR